MKQKKKLGILSLFILFLYVGFLASTNDVRVITAAEIRHIENLKNTQNLKEASKLAMQRYIDETETKPIYAVCDLDGDNIDEILTRTTLSQATYEPYRYLIRIAAYNIALDKYEISDHRKIEMGSEHDELHYNAEANRLIQAELFNNYNELYLQDGGVVSNSTTADIYEASPELKYHSGIFYAKYSSFDIEQITQADSFEESLKILLDTVENEYESEFFPNKYCRIDLNNDEINEIIIREYSPDYVEGGKFQYSIYEFDITRKCFCLLAGEFISYAFDALAYDAVKNSLVVDASFAEEPCFCFYKYENGKIKSTMIIETDYSYEALLFYNISDKQPTMQITSDHTINQAFYGIWCGAFKDYADAENMAYSLHEQGIDANIYFTPEWSNLNNEPWYALSAGNYSSEAAANEKLQTVQTLISNAYIKYSGEFIG